MGYACQVDNEHKHGKLRVGKSGGAPDALPRGRFATLIAPGGPKLKKPNEVITLQVTGDLTLGFLHRKVMNVMMHVAQQAQREARRRYPPLAFLEEKDREYYWAPLSEYCKDASFDSKDVALLKETIEELQQFRIKQENERSWLREVFVSSVRIELVQRQVWVGVAFAPEAKSLIARPREYTELALHYQAILGSGPSLVLYEVCRRYLTNKIPYTSRDPWGVWYYRLSGRPVGTKLPEFKYWKRDCLKRIEAEINQVTDIRVTRHEFPEGRRRVEELQYEVHPNEQRALDLGSCPPIDAALLGRIMALGVSQYDAKEYLGRYDEGTLVANLELVEDAKRQNRIATTAKRYLASALRSNYAGPQEAARAETVQRAKRERPNTEAPPLEALRHRFNNDRAAQALRLFDELGAEDRSAAQQRFLQADASDIVRRLYRTYGFETQLVRAAFGTWYARDLWDEPKEAELLEFASRELAVRNADQDGGVEHQ